MTKFLQKTTRCARSASSLFSSCSTSSSSSSFSLAGGAPAMKSSSTMFGNESEGKRTFSTSRSKNNNNNNNNNNNALREGEHFKKVIGFRPSKISSSQGASYMSNPWRLRDATQSGEVNHWENPLQGYISFGSEGKIPKTLEFKTREAMETFCQKRGWSLEIMEKKETEHFTQRGSSIIPGAGKIGTQPKAYGDNFSVNRKGLPIWP
jgi:hypothetical protein